MSRPKRTARVTVEDLFFEMPPHIRGEVLASLQTMDRLLRKYEAAKRERAPVQLVAADEPKEPA